MPEVEGNYIIVEIDKCKCGRPKNKGFTACPICRQWLLFAMELKEIDGYKNALGISNCFFPVKGSQRIKLWKLKSYLPDARDRCFVLRCSLFHYQELERESELVFTPQRVPWG